MGGYTNMNSASGMNAGTWIQGIGGLFNAYNQYQQGTAEQDMYNFQADQILMQAQSESEMVRRRGDRILSSQRAAMAASGMSLDSVTADDIAYSTEKDIALDELMIKYNANLEAFQSRQAGKNAKKAARIQAFNTLAGTAQQMSDSWYEWKKTSQGKSRKGKLQGKNVNVNYKNRYGNIG